MYVHIEYAHAEFHQNNKRKLAEFVAIYYFSIKSEK